MPIGLSDADREAAEEFIRRFAELDVSWHLDGNGRVRTDYVRINASISCFATEALYAFDTENLGEKLSRENPHRMKEVRLSEIEEYYRYRSRFSLSAEAWNAVWSVVYKTSSHDPELQRLLLEITKPRERGGEKIE